MLRLNLFPIDEIKEMNARHIKALKLLTAISVFMLVVATITIIVKWHSLCVTQEELNMQLNELTSIEANQQEVLDDLHTKQEKITAQIIQSENSVDISQFLRLLLHLKNKHAIIYEIKATTNQIEFAGFSNNQTSVIEFSEQIKKSGLVQGVTNFAINRVEKNTNLPKYSLTFHILVTMKKGGKT